MASPQSGESPRAFRRAWLTFLVVCAGLSAVGVVGGALLIERVKTQLYDQQAESERRSAQAMARVVERELQAGRPAAEVIARFQAVAHESSGQGNFLCLLDQTGVLLTHPDPAMVGMSKAATPMRLLRGGAPISYAGLIGRAEPASALVTGARAEPVELVYVQPVRGTTWTLGAHENARQIEERFQTLGWQLMAIVAPTVALMALVGTGLARAAGRRYERRIEAANAQLEARVAERTAELSTALGELQAAHEQLIQGEKMNLLGELMTGIAHEINNPLAVVIGFSEVLAKGDHPAEVRRHAGLIEASASRVRNIVENLLAFARRQPPSRRSVSAVTLMQRAIELIASDIRRAGVTLETDFAVDLEPLSLDMQQIEQVFLNLLNNARQALESHPGERIVRASVREDASGAVLVTVADTGPGLSERVRAQLFRPFTTTKEHGTGLGLSLCRRFVEAHGGRIEAPPVMRGTAFVVTLPRAAAAPALPSLLAAG